jgi:hypothetical protein
VAGAAMAAPPQRGKKYLYCGEKGSMPAVARLPNQNLGAKTPFFHRQRKAYSRRRRDVAAGQGGAPSFLPC